MKKFTEKFSKPKNSLKTNRTNNYETKISLFIIISFFLHLIFSITLFLFQYDNLMAFRENLKNNFTNKKNLIVNINQDKKKELTSKTLLSDQDSTAKGFLTHKKGDRWLNNSLKFSAPKKQSSPHPEKSLATFKSNHRLSLFIEKNNSPSEKNSPNKTDQVLIPDKNDITMENAIFYSNKGNFSFNTAKFKNFKYFQKMKEKIAANWFPPIMANAVIGGYNPITKTYTPGTMRIMAIPSQKVKIYFTINRSGEVLQVYLIDSYNNEPLDSSCLESIRLAKNFGKVPDNIKGKIIGVPFIFGYYSY